MTLALHFNAKLRRTDTLKVFQLETILALLAVTIQKVGCAAVRSVANASSAYPPGNCTQLSTNENHYNMTNI